MEHNEIMEAILDHKIEEMLTFRRQLEGGWFDDVNQGLKLRFRREASELYEAARDLDLGKPEGAVD